MKWQHLDMLLTCRDDLPASPVPTHVVCIARETLLMHRVLFTAVITVRNAPYVLHFFT